MGVPKLKPPPEVAEEKEKPVGAALAVVFGVPKLKPPPAVPPEAPKLN